MIEQPILFSGPMVRAILDGSKTMTRRVVNHYYEQTLNMMEGEENEWCPHGGTGDFLWVRETWATELRLDQFAPSTIRPCDNFRKAPAVLYAADTREKLNTWGKWRPSIFMPRWVSRIRLEITGVKVERVQDITEDDAEAEGCVNGARAEFIDLWDSINAKRGYGWDANPWVWAISFKRVTP